MKVKDLIKKLIELPMNKDILIRVPVGDGTCIWDKEFQVLDELESVYLD